MSTDDEFIQTIIANPDDDTPRLVYADWLDEQGDPRGEFIRVQCALATMADEDPRRWDLELRQARLLRWYGWQWWHNAFAPDARRPVFRRGFVEEAAVAGGEFLAQPDHYFGLYPLLQDLTLESVRPVHLPELLRLSLPKNLKVLRIGSTPLGRLGGAAIQALQAQFGNRLGLR